MKAEEKEIDVPIWVQRELTRHAMNAISSHNSEYDTHISIARTNGVEVLQNGGNIDEAFIEMNLYLSTID